jgi:hypothetical protein
MVVVKGWRGHFFVGKVSKNFEREIKESKKSRFFFEDSVWLGYQKEETICCKNCEYKKFSLREAKVKEYIMRSNENLGWVGVEKSKPFGTVWSLNFPPFDTNDIVYV